MKPNQRKFGGKKGSQQTLFPQVSSLPPSQNSCPPSPRVPRLGGRRNGSWCRTRISTVSSRKYVEKTWPLVGVQFYINTDLLIMRNWNCISLSLSLSFVLVDTRPLMRRCTYLATRRAWGRGLVDHDFDVSVTDKSGSVCCRAELRCQSKRLVQSG